MHYFSMKWMNGVLDIQKAYNKAINNFAEKMKYEYGSDEIHETIDEIAEQLKAGEE